MPRELWGYIAKRALEAIPLFFFIIIVSFTLVHLAPGDPVVRMIGEGVSISPELYNKVRAEMGLDRPIYEQLLAYLQKVIQGDLGFSYFYNQPVANLIAERLLATLLLMFTAMSISSVIGILLGVVSSQKPYSKTDNFFTTLSLVGYSLPLFWTGQIFILVFAIGLGLLPAQGFVSLRTTLFGFDYVIDVLSHLVLPASTYALYSLALMTRLTRASMLETLRKDFILTARSKGLADRTVIFRHGLRNALLPVVTIMGINFGFMLAGSVLVETVFSWPGLGRLLYDAITGRDYTTVMGMLIIISTMVIISNLIVDIAYAYIDPRISHR